MLIAKGNHLEIFFLRIGEGCSGVRAKGEDSSALTAALVRMLRPLVRLLLRRGVSLKSLYELLKWLFVDVAAEEFGPSGRHRAVSRISAMTGLTRKEVARLISLPESRDRESEARYNRAVARDRRLEAGPGILGPPWSGPASLALKGEGPTFAELVRRYSGDMTPKAMLDELLRIGAARVLRDGRIKLMVRSYIPGAGDGERLHILGADVGHLIRTIDHNLESADPPRNVSSARSATTTCRPRPCRNSRTFRPKAPEASRKTRRMARAVGPGQQPRCQGRRTVHCRAWDLLFRGRISGTGGCG